MFKMSKLRNSGLIRPQPIPSNCKYKYCDFVKMVYETQHVDKSEVEHLCCQLTHCVRLKEVDHEEEDILYNIFMLHAGQNCEFMHWWLKVFMTEVYKKNCQCRF